MHAWGVMSAGDGCTATVLGLQLHLTQKRNGSAMFANNTTT